MSDYPTMGMGRLICAFAVCMKQNHILAHQIRISAVFAHMRKFYLTCPVPTREKVKT